MVTAILPSLTDEAAGPGGRSGPSRTKFNARLSVAFSVESETTITPETYTRSLSRERARDPGPDAAASSGKPSALAGLVGSFTGCGALVALALFLPLPARFGERSGVTPGEAVAYSFYVVGAVALVVALFVFVGLRGLAGEDGKGWRALFGAGNGYDALRQADSDDEDERDGPQRPRVRRAGRRAAPPAADDAQEAVPYLRLVRDSVLVAFSDSRIAFGYLGGFVARASTVAISLFIPLFVNTYFISNGFCRGSPDDPSPELKKECRAAYVLSSILTGVVQLVGLLCAPLFGFLSGRRPGRVNYAVAVAGAFGVVGYVVLPQLVSPELGNGDGRGGSPAILAVVALVGVGQIGVIVCSLGSLGQGVIGVELPRRTWREPSMAPDDDESADSDALVDEADDDKAVSRVRLKGSIAGVYSLCGGLAILLLTKVGGLLFDKVSRGAPFYMMAAFNGVWLVASLLMDASRAFSRA